MENREKTVYAQSRETTVEEAVKALEKVLSLEIVSNSYIYADDFQNIVNRLRDKSFRLAVVGEFSSGKSTFLNALIGKDILKHGARETTATITEIQNVSEKMEGEVFDVYYENGEIKYNIPIDQLREYTATDSTLHQVAYEIERVVIKCNLFGTRDNVCFVDTPGLNGVADNHREKTINQIKNAHACIYLLQVRGLGQSDIDFIKFISKYQRNIIFVQNFIDEIKELEGDSVEGKLSGQKKILEEKVFDESSDIVYELIGISARKALMARDHGMEKCEEGVLDDSARERLFDESGFAAILEAVTRLMNKNKKNSIQKRETVLVAIALLRQLLDRLNGQKMQQDEIWNHSAEGRKRKNLDRIREELLKNRKQYSKNIENYVVSESSNIRQAVNQEIDVQVEEIYENVKKELNSIEDFNVFDDYARRLPQSMYELILGVENRSNERMNISFENLLCNAVLRINQYTGNEAKNDNINRFESGEYHIDRGLFQFEADENEVSKLKSELAGKRADLEANRKKRSRMEEDIKKADHAIRLADVKIRQIEQEKKSAVSELGSKPEAETKYYTETYQESRGKIMNFLFGPKKRKRKVPYNDYSKQEKWLKKKSDIELSYKKQQDQIKSENNILMNQIKNYQDDIRHLDRLEPERQKDIQRIKDLLDAKIENIEVKKKKAQREYLQNLKHALSANVRSYLYDNVRNCIVDSFEEAVDVNRAKVLERTSKLFEDSFNERMNHLSEVADETEKEKKREKIQQDIKTVSDTIGILEVYA